MGEKQYGNTIDVDEASNVIKKEWSEELKLIENYIFEEITKKIDTYDIEDIVKSCVEKSDGIKEILKKLSVIEGMLVNLSNQLLFQGTTYTSSSPNSWNNSIWSSSNLTANIGPDQVSLGDLLSVTHGDPSTLADSSTTECGK